MPLAVWLVLLLALWGGAARAQELPASVELNGLVIFFGSAVQTFDSMGQVVVRGSGGFRTQIGAFLIMADTFSFFQATGELVVDAPLVLAEGVTVTARELVVAVATGQARLQGAVVAVAGQFMLQAELATLAGEVVQVQDARFSACRQGCEPLDLFLMAAGIAASPDALVFSGGQVFLLGVPLFGPALLQVRVVDGVPRISVPTLVLPDLLAAPIGGFRPGFDLGVLGFPLLVSADATQSLGVVGRGLAGDFPTLELHYDLETNGDLLVSTAADLAATGPDLDVSVSVPLDAVRVQLDLEVLAERPDVPVDRLVTLGRPQAQLRAPFSRLELGASSAVLLGDVPLGIALSSGLVTENVGMRVAQARRDTLQLDTRILVGPAGLGLVALGRNYDGADPQDDAQLLSLFADLHLAVGPASAQLEFRQVSGESPFLFDALDNLARLTLSVGFGAGSLSVQQDLLKPGATLMAGVDLLKSLDGELTLSLSRLALSAAFDLLKGQLLSISTDVAFDFSSTALALGATLDADGTPGAPMAFLTRLETRAALRTCCLEYALRLRLSNVGLPSQEAALTFEVGLRP
ncbi:MAG: hypothetical protein HY335_09120 [Deinococcus sp.]|nr:hypothetical protein [Deinococcus sp.]